MAVMWAVVLVAAFTANSTAPVPDSEAIAAAEATQPVAVQLVDNL